MVTRMECRVWRGQQEVSRRSRALNLVRALLSGFDFGSLQKIVTPRWIQLQPVYAFGVHQHVVEIPQIDVRQVSRQDRLYFRIENLALLLVRFPPRLIDQVIQSRVGVETSIRALGRKLRGVKRILENI